MRRGAARCIGPSEQREETRSPVQADATEQLKHAAMAPRVHPDGEHVPHQGKSNARSPITCRVTLQRLSSWKKSYQESYRVGAAAVRPFLVHRALQRGLGGSAPSETPSEGSARCCLPIRTGFYFIFGRESGTLILHRYAKQLMSGAPASPLAVGEPSALRHGSALRPSAASRIRNRRQGAASRRHVTPW